MFVGLCPRCHGPLVQAPSYLPLREPEVDCLYCGWTGPTRHPSSQEEATTHRRVTLESILRRRE